eukprot:GILK01022838.1.p1 GENE.GILK01022838.1~~GILK01022838.1.p1  ORF type:complete len:395 (+),score=59.68 GILK01022838.1:150-1187(+)
MDAESSLRSSNATDIARWSAASGLTEEEAKDTPELRKSRKGLALTKTDKVLLASNLTLLTTDAAAAVAENTANALSTAQTLSQYLMSSGATVATVHNIRRAVEKRFATSGLLAPGKIACLVLTSTSEEMEDYFGAKGVDGLKATLEGKLIEQNPSFALAAITTAVGSAGEGQEVLYFTAQPQNIVGFAEAAVGSLVVIPPLSPFSTRGTKVIKEGDVTVTLKGTERAIFTSAATVRPSAALALTCWFAEYEIVSKDEGHMELAFVRFVFDESRDSLSEAARPSQIAEDDSHTAISQLQRSVEVKASIDGVPAAPFDEAAAPPEPKEEVQPEEEAQPEEEEAAQSA